jgi:hypothetical protein
MRPRGRELQEAAVSFRMAARGCILLAARGIKMEILSHLKSSPGIIKEGG